MSSEQTAVTAQDLGKTYWIFDRPSDRLKQLLFAGRRQYGRAFHALQGISFELQRGQVLGLVGNNGAGKSTLLQLVCRTLQPTAGRLQVNGRVAALLELGAGFNPEFSGRENIFLNAAVLGLSAHETAQRFDDIVAFSGVGDFIEQPVKTYSSGMYVRLAFSIATSVAPDILIIDEALSVGDGEFARKSFDRIMDLKAKGATILFCSHSMYHIEAICDLAMWLEHGRMMMLDEPHKVTKAYGGKTAQVSSVAGWESSVNTGVASSVAIANAGVSASAAYEKEVIGARFVSIQAWVDGEPPARLLRLRAGGVGWTIRARFAFDRTLALPSVAFGIDTATGVGVSSGSTLFDQEEPSILEPGLGEVTLRFPRTVLMRGSYQVTLFLACERTLHVYDHALNCATLEVSHDGAEQGLCFLPHSWNAGQTVDVPMGKPL